MRTEERLGIKLDTRDEESEVRKTKAGDLELGQKYLE